jgi:hypothetical protein
LSDLKKCCKKCFLLSANADQRFEASLDHSCRSKFRINRPLRRFVYLWIFISPFHAEAFAYWINAIFV